MSITIFLIIIGFLIIAYSGCSFWLGRSVKNTSDYFLADRDLGLFPVTFTLIATQLGGGMLLGTSQEAYRLGIFGIVYTLSMIVGFLLLSAGIAGRLQSLNIATTAQLFETVYQAPLLKKVASALSITTLSGILVSQIVGARALLCGVGITNAPLFIAFWLFIIMYTMIGGLKTVVWIDSIQVLYIFFIFSALFIWCIMQEPHTLFSFAESSFAEFSFAEFSFAQLRTIQRTFVTADFNYRILLPTLIMPALFALIEQDLAQRFFAARTKKVAVVAALCAGILLFFFACIPVYFGMKARLLGLPVAANASPLLPAIGYLTNELVVAFAVAGILAAITSTADSLLCAISSNMAQDFSFSFLGAINKLWLSKVITLLVGIICLTASYYVPTSIIGLIISSYALSVVCLLVPLLAAYYNKQLPKQAAVASIFCGLFGLLFFWYVDSSIPAELLALGCSFVGFMVGLVL